jgi:N-acetylglucosaminyldiphosphoundecaprenol N-acetyl-beta-D-mannosaminyltransferase
VAASNSHERSTINILGYPVDVLSPDEVWQRIDEALKPSHPNHCFHVATLNPEYVMAARHDTAFADALKRADLVTADGVGVALAARLNHGRVIGRVTGVDVLRYLAGKSQEGQTPLFLLGAGSGVAAEAAQALEEVFPESRINGWWSEGTADRSDDAEALKRIVSCGAKAVAVAYGGRGQVMWIDRNIDALSAEGVRIAVGVGGAFDFVAGRIPRAPEPIQRIGMEWLYRLGREPWRWRRQLVLPRFAALVAAERLGIQKRDD